MESKSDSDSLLDTPSCSVGEQPSEKGGTIHSSDTEETPGRNNERRASTDDLGKTHNVKDLNQVMTEFDNPNGQEIGNIEVDRGKDSQPGEEKIGVGPSGDTLKENKLSDKKDQSKETIHSLPELEEHAIKDSAVKQLKEVKPKHFSSDSHQTKTIHSEPEHDVEDNDSKIQEELKQISGDSQSKKTIHTEPEYTAKDNASEFQVKEEKLKQISSESQSKKTIHSEPEYTAEDNASDLQEKEEEPKQFSSDSLPKKTIHSEPAAEDNAASGTPPQDEDEDGSLQQLPFTGFAQQRQPQISAGGDSRLLWIGFIFVVLAVICGSYLPFSDSTLPVPNKFNVVEMFNQEMDKLKTSFPSQHSELWKRSLIHLRRHLKTEHPTEPVSLILTSGRGAEKTLGCLAQCLAQAFSTTRNSSVLSINGKGKTSLDSDQVKLDMDSELTRAFEGKTFAAVIHRFEELPPGSTLIFYRYCDHENAAYKNVFLAFTIMLDAEVEVLSNVNLSRVEEIVLEYVKQKFVSSDRSALFNQMDLDKLSGLWSRISHLILPVVAEKRIEQQGCGDCNKS